MPANPATAEDIPAYTIAWAAWVNDFFGDVPLWSDAWAYLSGMQDRRMGIRAPSAPGPWLEGWQCADQHLAER